MGKEYRELLEKFKIVNGKVAECCAIAPGRVNLIGEHIDYNGYGVLPLALTQSVMIAASKRDDNQLHISNVNPKHKQFSADTNKIVIDQDNHAWYNYLLCGIKGLLDEDILTKLKGMTMLVTSDLASSCGLSSSSALVCAAALCVVELHGLDVSMHYLAEICARSERYVGTQGGGMDQAASLLSKKGFAQHIEFNPLRCCAVELPTGASFVVANSQVEKDKASSSEFNQRVVECRFACRVLARKLDVPWQKGVTLKDLQIRSDKTIKEMVTFVDQHLHRDVYSKEQLASALDLPMSSIDEMLTDNTQHLSAFQLHARARHVYTEADRVLQFKHTCQQYAQGHVSNECTLLRLGQLMNESHESTRTSYECSHPSLDELVTLSKGVALGARLTGAGWGGCIVALVRDDNVEEYIKKLTDNYYLPRDVPEEKMSELVFKSVAGSGASVKLN